MNESLSDTSQHASISRSRWALLLRRFFPLYPSELTGLLSTEHHAMVFERQRAGFILSRTRLMAGVFAVLTPLWIPLDMLAFPQSVWLKLAASRLAVGLAFAMIAIYCRRATTLRQAYMALAALFFIPSLFFLYSNSLLWGLHLSRGSATLASGYAFLIFIMVAGLSIFPLTVSELAVLALPMLAIAGALVLWDRLYMVPLFNALALLWLLLLVAVIGCLASISQLQLLRHLFKRSAVDPLTGALTRESGAELISLQLALARRNRYPLSLAFVDMDNFKQINDAEGHGAGDATLESVVLAWREALRMSDAVLRWGGDEFILLLPYTDRAQARRLIDADFPELASPGGKRLSWSVGIAEYAEDGIEQWQELVRLADKRMYRAKATGKDRSVEDDAPPV